MGRISFLTSLAALALAACGGAGPKQIPSFTEGVIGGDGGTLEAGGVRLVVPAGGLAGDTVVKILPQPDPLPIDPSVPPVARMPGFMCIGPVGQNLLVSGHVRFCYDPATIPLGSTEADVVLLEWDAVAGFLRISQTAVQDTTTHCFEDDVYGELGHIGVGAVLASPLDLVFASNANANGLVAARAVPGVVGLPPNALVLASSANALLPTLLPDTADAEGYVASRDGTKVIWRRFDVQFDGSDLLSTEVADGTLNTLLTPAIDRFLGSDPLYGSISSSDVYYGRSRFEDDVFGDTFAHVGVTGTPSPSDLYFDMSQSGDLVDVRVSPDETMVLLRYRDFGKGVFDALFVVDAVTGDEIGAFLPGVDDSTAPTPRWLPDSSGLYYVELDLRTVSRVPPDGSAMPVTLYTLPPDPNAFLQDFVIAPSYAPAAAATTPCAYVMSHLALVAGAAVGDPGNSIFVRDVLGGGAVASVDLGSRLRVDELIYHPNGTKVIADLVDDSLRLTGQAVALVPETVRIFDATTAAQLHTYATTLEYFDLDRVSGELVVWFPTGGVDANFPVAGLFRLAANGDTIATIDTNGLVPTGPARFLRSWRRTPGEFASYVR